MDSEGSISKYRVIPKNVNGKHGSLLSWLTLQLPFCFTTADMTYETTAVLPRDKPDAIFIGSA